MDLKLQAFERLINIMNELREKCPWDKKQTFESLRTLTIEEVYELSEAIVSKDYNELSKEIGDVFLHLVFYCKIGEEQGVFDVTKVLNEICDKLIHRHPHIYGETKVQNEEEVKANWEKLKLKEGKKSVLEGVPKGLPSLIKALRIQDKVKGVGFEWKEIESVWNKFYEEIDELKHAIANKNQEEIELEFGDVIFSLINLSRFLNVNPEDALEKVNHKFITRFQLMEKLIIADNKNITDLELEIMDIYWEKAKEKIKNSRNNN